MFLTVTLVVLVVAALWLYNKRCLTYWAERGIPSPPALPFFGNFIDIVMGKPGRWIFDEKVYRNYNKGGLGGAYNFLSPILYISDLELMKSVLVKDFDHFADRQQFLSQHKNDRAMNEMLFNANGERWKSLRNLMTPAFTSGKMKNMFHLVCDKADDLMSFCIKESAKKPAVNVKMACGRYTIDSIASCAFGLECNSFEDEKAVFPSKVQPFFEANVFRMIKFAAALKYPSITGLMDFNIFPEEKFFFQKVAEETLAARRKGHKRGDFLDLLLEAQAIEENNLSDEQTKQRVLDDITIISQSILFIIVGYDTTATTIAITSYLLSKNPAIQQRLRQELQDTVNKEGKLTYQGVMESKYLDACINETLRLYPPAPNLERICSKDYQVPGTNITVRKGDLIEIPIWSIHHDEKYWPDPEVFDPDRFMPENKANIVPYTHMPFGGGPRNCIGMRFALLEAKVALAKFVLNFDMKTAPGFHDMQLQSGAFLIMPKAVDLVLDPLREE